MADNALVVNTGTALTMASDDIGGVNYPRMKLSVGADGAAADWAGTVGTVDKINSGSIDILAIGRRHADEFATVISSGTSDMGTIKAAVSGSVIYVTGIIVSVGSASNVVIASGGTSTPVIGSMFFNANGGVAALPFDPPIRTASGSALVYKQSVSGPLSITCVGYVD